MEDTRGIYYLLVSEVIIIVSWRKSFDQILSIILHFQTTNRYKIS